MCRGLMLVVALVLSLRSGAQIPYVDSKEVLERGVALFDKGEYKKALEQYRMVHECDTNYVSAVYEEVLALQGDSAFVDARNMAIGGLRLPNADRRNFLLALAATYDYLGKQDSALVLYDSVVKLYPHDHQPRYEKGIISFKKKQYDEALGYFQHSLIINPNHYRSHYMMGLIFALQGRLSESLIALEGSLLMTNNADLARQSITVINSIVEEPDEIVKYYHARDEKYSHPVFDDIDQLINSKLALTKDYKLQMSLNDNVFRQTQVMMEKLKFNAQDTNFVMQYYVPLLTQIFAKDMFEPFMLLMFSGYGFENVDKLAKKKDNEVAEVKAMVFPYFTKIQATRQLNYNKRVFATDLYHYYPKDNLIIVGEAIGREDNQSINGDVAIYRGNQSLLSTGHYGFRGEKDRLWTVYYANGHLKTKEYYTNNQVRDSSFAWFNNGNLNKVVTRDRSGEINAEYEYDYNGWLSFVRKKTGEKTVVEYSLYPNGMAEDTMYYEDGKIKDGTYRFYYRSGKIKKQATFGDEKYSGVCTTYYEHGNVSERAGYSKGILDGPYAAYYESGQLKEKYTNSNGRADGPYEEYYANGKISDKGEYNRGNKDEIEECTEAGRLYKSITLKNNVPVKIKYTDDDNKTVFEKEERNGILEYPIFFANGNKAADMKINDKGERNGWITFYCSTGAKSGETNYKDGNKQGKSVTYFRSGKTSTEQDYANDEKDGYYKSYFSNGSIEEEGWYKHDKKQGPWRTYYANGKLKDEKYFLNNSINGYQKEYNTNGEITDKYLFDYNAIAGQVCYDASGNVTDSQYFNSTSGTWKFSHSHKGNRDVEYSVQYGNINGPYLGYYENGAAKYADFFKDGFKDSLSVNWFPDGTINSKGSYRKGDKVGKWEYYNEAGELIKEEQYDEDGLLEGKVSGYAARLRHVEYNYRKGSHDGAQTYYGENGRAAFVLFFDHGDLTGYSYEGKDGKLLSPISLKNGTGNMIAYYQNGQKSGEGTFEQNMVLGKLSVYYTNGQLAEERNYKGFELHGPFRRYNADGKLAYEVNYKDDNEDGIEQSFDGNGNLIISVGYSCGEKHGPTKVTNPLTKKTKTYDYHYGQLTGVSE